MADATLAQLRTQVMQELSALAGGETVDATDAALIDARIVSCNEELRELEICYWSDTAFPQSILNALALYVAAACAGPMYPGAPMEAEQFRLTKGPDALRRLRVLTASRERMDKPTRAEYF